MKQQINFRASDLTAEQIAKLTQQTGMLQTEVIAVAIDRMYQEEIDMAQKFVYTGTALGSFDFTGTEKQYRAMLADLRKSAPEFAGNITTGQALSDFRSPNERKYTSCLFYNGEKIAEAV